MLILILILLLLLVGGGGYYVGPGVGYYGGGAIDLILLVVILYLLFGRGRTRLQHHRLHVETQNPAPLLFPSFAEKRADAGEGIDVIAQDAKRREDRHGQEHARHAPDEPPQCQ